MNSYEDNYKDFIKNGSFGLKDTMTDRERREMAIKIVKSYRISGVELQDAIKILILSTEALNQVQDNIDLFYTELNPYEGACIIENIIRSAR